MQAIAKSIVLLWKMFRLLCKKHQIQFVSVIEMCVVWVQAGET